MISFRIDWFDLLAVQGTLKSFLLHHNWNVSILQGSSFFEVQLSYPYMTTGKTIALTTQTFVGKVISLCLGPTFGSTVNVSTCTSHIVKPNKLKCQSLVQKKVY